jgi:hypothetical protein
VTVKIFQRNTVVTAFRIPLWGKASDETPPKWLVERLQSGELEINSLGGLTVRTPFGVLSCAAGDYVLFTSEETIEFANPETFAKFEVVEELRIAA